MPVQRFLPWGRPRHQLLLITLIAAATLTVLPSGGAGEASHICLAKALIHGRLTIDGCAKHTVDRSLYGGHRYSNKAPGLSVLEAPIVAVVQPSWRLDARLWATRLVSGASFLLCLLLVGRVSEGFAPGAGGFVMTVVGLGTIMAPLANVGFSHVPVACLGFAAFVLAWSRRAIAAGLAAGLALLIEYEGAVILLAVGAYCAVRGIGQLLRYVAAAAPGAGLLGLYQWVCFGAPWRNPLSYSDNVNRQAHHEGFLGLRHPSESAVKLITIGYRGLFTLSPVLLLSAVGLWLLWRRGLRAEAVTCLAVCLVYLMLDASYFDPYGTSGPGPRFVAPAVPFAAVGIAAVVARFRWLVIAFAIPSVIATLAITLTWTADTNYAGSIWGQLIRLPGDRGKADTVRHLLPNVLGWAHVGRIVSATFVLICGAAAMVLALRSRPKTRYGA
jgi:hypothetical protein